MVIFIGMDIQRVINSTLGLRAVSVAARTLPPRLGHKLADAVADLLAGRREAAIIGATRLNQWVARGEELRGEALDAAVRETLRCSARSIFDLHHYVQDLSAAGRLIRLDAIAEELTRRPEFEGRGLVVIGLHMSNFDLVLQWMCTQEMRPLVLTIPDPQGGRRMEFEIRKRTGMNLVPASVGTLRQAVRYLQQGGMVVTGMDRPVEESGLRPRFFGRPSALPVHHIYLALKAQVPVRVLYVTSQADGKYHVASSELLEMESLAGKGTETLRNAEKVLSIAEGFIRQAPGQWSVPLPVWPDLINLVPG